MTGLVGCSAMVSVGPPLSARPPAANSGLEVRSVIAAELKQLGPAGLKSSLKPLDERVPPVTQFFPPPRGSARIVLIRLLSPPSTRRFAPSTEPVVGPLSAIVLLAIPMSAWVLTPPAIV